MDYEQPPVEIGECVADKYRIREVLGSGGVGVVVAADHLELEEIVALKFLKRRASSDAVLLKRFMREAKAAARLKSEHATRVMDVGRLDDGSPYMVMEFLNGSDLSAVLTEHRKLPVEVAVDFILQACEAVAEAHSHGIIHRDLKPANLFLTKRADGSPLIKVLDFGIAKANSENALEDSAKRLTSSQAMVGSPLYMSPEQIQSPQDVDARSDIWSLGVILYELLTGRPPFDGTTLPTLLAALLSSTAEPMRMRRLDLPEELDRAVLRCLHRDRDQRPQDLGALARDLVPFASEHGRPYVHRIVSVLERRDLADTDGDSGMLRSGPRSLLSSSSGDSDPARPRDTLQESVVAVTRPSNPKKFVVAGAAIAFAAGVLAAIVAVLTRPEHHAVAAPSHIDEAPAVTASITTAASPPASIPPAAPSASAVPAPAASAPAASAASIATANPVPTRDAHPSTTTKPAPPTPHASATTGNSLLDDTTSTRK